MASRAAGLMRLLQLLLLAAVVAAAWLYRAGKRSAGARRSERLSVIRWRRRWREGDRRSCGCLSFPDGGEGRMRESERGSEEEAGR